MGVVGVHRAGAAVGPEKQTCGLRTSLRGTHRAAGSGNHYEAEIITYSPRTKQPNYVFYIIIIIKAL